MTERLHFHFTFRIGEGCSASNVHQEAELLLLSLELQVQTRERGKIPDSSSEELAWPEASGGHQSSQTGLPRIREEVEYRMSEEAG